MLLNPLIDIRGYHCLIALLAIGCLGCEPTPQEAEALFTYGATTLAMTTVADSLDVPWEICAGPGGQLWVAEQSGKISRIDPETGVQQELLSLKDVYRLRTGGLLGMTLHPDMDASPYVFIAYVAKNEVDQPVSRIVRYTYAGDTLVAPLEILEYAAWNGHYGARLVIAPDGMLMVATGDGAQHGNAQDVRVPHGKILRYRIDGSIPADNPIPGSPVWAWGLRNPQGLAYATDGQLYSSGHGDAIADEVNKIIKGGNYGWPVVEGFADTDLERAVARDSVIQEPLRAWTPTIGPAGLALYESDILPEFRRSILLTTLKGNGLHVLKLDADGSRIVADTILFQQLFGRLRSVCVTPAGDIYIGTSNRDWNPNGFAEARDDRIIRLSKATKQQLRNQQATPAAVANQSDVVSRGELLYTDYCASCHQANGRGVAGVFPSLYQTGPVAAADADALIRLVLEGRGEMPAFHFLEDKELAIILSYVRKRFGPQASRVSGVEVAARRPAPASGQ
ncbi:PQQ-dependent sugar dehydrogenase [Parapedobacter lycopersici]|uniref:PQQ-dependent sugar dehydrogenase n=1 Tax=Parapedobacter lycopersici TaxID=1864939 RepID=UPI0033405081